MTKTVKTQSEERTETTCGAARLAFHQKVPQSTRMRKGRPLLYDPAVLERVEHYFGTEDPAKLRAVENLVHMLRTYSLLYEQLSALLAPHGLSVAKYNLLAILLTCGPEHRLPMSEIGTRMSVTCANITKLVDALERQNWVRRTRLPGDRRIVLAELTSEGEAKLQAIMPPHYESVRRLWAGMEEDDCLELTHLLLKLRNSLSASQDTMTRVRTGKTTDDEETDGTL